VPQVFEHWPKSPKAPTWQATGQHCVLQDRASERAGQAWPLQEAFRVIDRVLVCCPPPHCLLQAPQALKLDTAQATGQHWVLQFRVSERLGHALPPQEAFVVTDRVLVCCPVPHCLEQAPQALQPETAQFRLQQWVLQFLVSVRAGHAFPPDFRFRVIGLDLVCWPPPQDLLHPPQLPQPPTVQCRHPLPCPHPQPSSYPFPSGSRHFVSQPKNPQPLWSISDSPDLQVWYQ